MSYQEKKAEGQLGLVLTLVFLFVFLFLAALYESWLVPVAVLVSLHVAALGAYLGILGFGLENDIYFQIGLVTLIGLAAKNAILIVEFARDFRKEGNPIRDSALEAGHVRLRPILMTSLSTVLGILPMAMATGAGAESRVAMGIAVVGGMVCSTLLTLFVIPAIYTYLSSKEVKIIEEIED